VPSTMTRGHVRLRGVQDGVASVPSSVRRRADITAIATPARRSPSLRPFLEVLATRAVRRPLLGAAIGRLTPGMVVLALILAAREAALPYAAVGLLVAAHQLGVAAGSPLQGRLADRLGHARVLMPDALAYLAGTTLLALGLARGWPVLVLLATAAATGFSNPPTTSCSRALIVQLVLPGRARVAAFAVSTASAEIGFIVGPLATVAIATAAGPRAALVTAGLAAAVGALVYASSPTTRDAAPTSDAAPVASSDGAASEPPTLPDAVPPAGWREALGAPGLARLATVFLLVSVGFGAFDLYLAAFSEARGTPNLAGALIAVAATSSLTGGFVFAARVWQGDPLARQRRITALLALALLMMPAAGDRLLLLGVALVAVGASVGPFNVAGYQLAGELTPARVRTEGQAWTQAAVYLGSALGGSLAGLVIDLAGPAAAMVMGAAAAGLGALLLGPAGLAPPAPPDVQPAAGDQPVDR
jgi:MFS family permease